jgi:integrase/recombinase XerD
LEYFKKIKDKYSITSYRKQTYQIRKFLTYLNIDWAKNIKPPKEPQSIPKRITKEDVKSTLSYFKGHESFLKIKSLILLGATSGMRAHELYQLTPEDIDIENRIIHVYHDPSNGHTTKTKKSRIAMFNEEAKQILKEYLSTYFEQDNCNRLYPKRYCQHVFKYAPLHVKHLRKFFSQEWDRRGGPTSIKKLLMGHRSDVDLKHYNSQNEQDLRDIYDSVGLAI